MPSSIKRNVPRINTSSDGVVRVLAAVERNRPALAIERIVGPLSRATRALPPDADDAVVATFLGLLRPRLGEGAHIELRMLSNEAHAWAVARFDPCQGSFKAFLIDALRRALALLVRRYGRRLLQLEWADEKLRALALTSEKYLAEYLHFVESMLRRVISLDPRRWHVAGRTRDELIADLRVEIWEALQNGSLANYLRPGVAASVAKARSAVRAWRKQRLLVEVQPATDDYAQRETVRQQMQEPQPLADLLQAESQRIARGALDKVKSGGSSTQKRWLAAMELDVRMHGRLNMERVAQQLGRRRSAGSRMRSKMQRLLARHVETDE